MLEWLDRAAGPAYTQAVFWTLFALLALFVVLLAVRIFRSFTFGTYVAGGRNRKTRLAVMDATAVDSHRRLILVRRDDTEHLLLIGGPSDVVVERDIRISQLRRPAGDAPIPQLVDDDAAAPQPMPPPAAPRVQDPARQPPRPAPASPPPPRLLPERPAPIPGREPSLPRRVEPRVTAPQPAPPVAAAPTPAPVGAPRPPQAPPAAPPQAVKPPPAPTAPAPQPKPAPVAAIPGVIMAPAPATPQVIGDELDDALLKELEVSLDGSEIQTVNKTPSLDDEMAKLLGELSTPRKK
jgi:hypothetical protein